MYIYRIQNTETGDCYIGQTIQSPNKRFTRHRCDLNKQKHDNIMLQRAWDKYTPSAFKFEVIKTCESLLELEEEEFKYILEEGSYNIFKNKQSSPAPKCYINRIVAEKHHNSQGLSEATKQKISKTKKKFFENGGVNSMQGRHHTIKSKQKISKTLKERYSDSTQHGRYDDTVWEFVNEKTKESFKGTKKQFINYTQPKTKNKIYCICNGTKRSYKGWIAICITEYK